MNPSASAQTSVHAAPAPDAGHGRASGPANHPTIQPAIDPATLARLHELDPDGKSGIVLRVLRTYGGALASALSSIGVAADAQHAVDLRHLTHTLKSSSASVGALRLAALCGDAERIAREGWRAELSPLLASLINEGRRVQAALVELIPELR